MSESEELHQKQMQALSALEEWRKTRTTSDVELMDTPEKVLYLSALILATFTSELPN